MGDRTVYVVLALVFAGCGDSAGQGGSSADAAGGSAPTPATGVGAAVGGGGDGGAAAAGGGGGGPTNQASCRLGWCWVAPGIDGSTFLSVGVDESGGVWFGGEASTLLRWDGVQFQRHELWDAAPDLDVSTILATSPNDVWVSGGHHFDGVAWTSTPLQALLGRLEDGTVLGLQGAALVRWDGLDWVPAPVSPVGVQGAILVAGASIDDFAVLETSGRVQAYQAGGWAALAPDQGWSVQRDRALAFSDGSFAVIQSSTLPAGLWTLETTGWSYATQLPEPQAFAGGSRDDLFIYAGVPARHRFHWDGLALNDLGPYAGEVRAAATVPGGTVFEAGHWGLLRSYASGVETDLQPGPFPGSGDVSSSPPGFTNMTLTGVAWIDDELWVGTDRAEALRYDGTAWESVPLTAGPVHSIWGTSASDVWFVGDVLVDYDDFNYPRFASYLHRYDGVSVTLEDASSYSLDRRLRAWGHTTGEVYVWGLGQAEHYDGSSFTAGDGRRARHGVSPSDFWAATAVTLDHFDGSTWTSYPFLESGHTQAIYSFAPDDVWAHHADGLYSLSNGVLFRKTLPFNLDPSGLYLRTPSVHHLFVGRTLWTFSGDDPMLATETLTFFYPSGAVTDPSGTLYVRVAGGVLRRQ